MTNIKEHGEIEQNIPITKIRPTGKPSSPTPISKLEIGESFFVPNTDKQINCKIRCEIFNYKKRHPGTEFATSQQGTGLRIWRVESRSNNHVLLQKNRVK